MFTFKIHSGVFLRINDHIESLAAADEDDACTVPDGCESKSNGNGHSKSVRMASADSNEGGMSGGLSSMNVKISSHRIFNKFHVVKEVGQGSFGKVYLVREKFDSVSGASPAVYAMKVTYIYICI